LASTICLTMANRSKGATRAAVNARHRHHVAGARQGCRAFRLSLRAEGS
jgi:hypothetical protein